MVICSWPIYEIPVGSIIFTVLQKVLFEATESDAKEVPLSVTQSWAELMESLKFSMLGKKIFVELLSCKVSEIIKNESMRKSEFKETLKNILSSGNTLYVPGFLIAKAKL